MRNITRNHARSKTRQGGKFPALAASL